MKYFYLILGITFFMLSSFTKAQSQSIIETDTLIEQNPWLDTISAGMDTIELRLNQIEDRKDSVVQHFTSPLDSLLQTADQKQDSIVNKLNNKAAEIEQKITTDNQVAKQADKLEEKIQSKVEEVENSSIGKVIPAPTDNHLKHLNQVKELSDQADNFRQNSIKRINHIKPVEQTKAYLDQAEQLKSKVSAYENKIHTLPEDKINQLKQLPSAMEEKALQVKELEALQTQSQQLEDWKQQYVSQQDQFKQYQDQAYLKEQGQAKLQEKAKNHFAAHADKLKSAQEKLEKFKRKYTGEKTAAGKLIKQSSLQGKPLGERLVWGGQFQALPGTAISVDLSPILGYQLNKLWMIAAGGSYRAELQPNKNYRLRKGETYGIRAFTEHKVFKGFFMHGEYELTNQAMTNNVQDTHTRDWIKGILIGIGNTYHITDKLKGHVTVLYNLAHQEQSPYPRPWMVRFGFTVGEN